MPYQLDMLVFEGMKMQRALYFLVSGQSVISTATTLDWFSPQYYSEYLKFVRVLLCTVLVTAIESEVQSESTTQIASEEEFDAITFSDITTLIIDSSSKIFASSYFNSFPNLTHLFLSARIQSLPENLFASVPRLTDLNLDHNLLTSIPTAALSDLPNLETLSISNNRLETLAGDGDEFLSLGHLRSLSLGGNFINSLHPHTFASLRELKVLNMSSNWLTSFDGTALPPNSQLEVLDLSYNYIKLLNGSVFYSLSVLKQLSLAGNLLETLPDNTFAVLRELERLDLCDNFFKSLPSRLFTSNGKLAELSLAENLLEHLPVNLFAGLRHLELLNLRNNRLTKLPAETFRDQPLFTQISLEGNRIVKFHSGFLKSSDVQLQNNRLTALGKFSTNSTPVQRLYLYGNEIATIEQSVLEGLPKLETIYLDYNRITELSPMLFHTNHALQHVTLSHNRLSVLRTNTFSGLGRLHSVDLSYNRLSALEPAIFHRSPVEYLNLNGNQLKTLDEWVLSGTNLLYLHLDANGIGSLASVGTVLDGLVELSAASNRIASWQELCARNFSRLTAINLANNSLPSMDGGCLERTLLPRSSQRTDPVTVSVASNKLSEVPVLAGPIRALDLSGNNVSDLGDGYQFRWYQHTEVLLLRDTLLRVLRSASFTFLQHLTQLELSSSVLEHIEEDALHRVKLQRLEISNSPLGTLPPLLLKGQTNLSHVSFTNNELSHLAPTFFTDCVRLEDINLSFNALETVYPDWFFELEDVHTINLEGNRITQLQPDLLSTEHSLQYLSLAGNALHSIADAVFLADVPIKALNLSNNRHLQDIDILQRNEFITRLDVSGNRLKRLTVRPNYRTLLANSNRITSLHLNDYTDSNFNLEHLHLADNLLEQLDPRIFELRTLSVLNVSENRLDTFPFEQTHKLKQLRTLIVSRNNIRTLPALGEAIRFKLETLDLTENPLEEPGAESFLSSCVVENLLVTVTE
uniref:Chaoptin n=1 Tax=Anopheles maculatus TaxID=74869 RepID=A0A182SQA6_9DIPT